MDLKFFVPEVDTIWCEITAFVFLKCKAASPFSSFEFLRDNLTA